MKPVYDLHVHMTDTDLDSGLRMLDIMAGMGVKKAALQSLTYRSIAYNLWLLYWKKHYKKIELCTFGMIHNEDFYSKIPFEIQAKALIDMGCDGIKMMYAPNTRKRLGYGIDDERYDKMFTYLEDNSIPAVIHVNDPEEFWIPRELTESEKERGWGFFTGGFLSKQEIYDETFRMLDKHPRLRVTFAHFFFLSNFREEAERVMETYPNVCFDLTPGWEMFIGFSKDIDGWQTFFEKYADRIFFGTDSNDTKNFNAELNLMVRMAISHDKTEFILPAYRCVAVKGLDLSESALDKICRENYERWVGTPRPVDTEAYKAAAERLLTDLDRTDEPEFQKAAKVTQMLLEII